MPRIARIVVPGLPHHVTQRGNRRERVFLEPGDYVRYRALLSEQTRKHGITVWGYCLMPNHVHLILTPEREDGLARAIGETHRRYTSFINTRMGQTGHLFQARFASAAMDEHYCIAAVRYVGLNPVRAGLVRRPEDWPWSSARAWLGFGEDGLTDLGPAHARELDFASLLDATGADDGFDALRNSEHSGLPLGSANFIANLEAKLDRRLGRGLLRNAPSTEGAAR